MSHHEPSQGLMIFKKSCLGLMISKNYDRD